MGMILNLMLVAGIIFFYLSPTGYRDLGLGVLSWPCQLGTEPRVGEREVFYFYLFFELKNLPIRYICFIFLLKATLTVSYLVTHCYNAEFN